VGDELRTRLGERFELRGELGRGGVGLLRQRGPAAAAEPFARAKALSESPFGRVHSVVGLYHYRLGRVAPAIAAYDDAIAEEPRVGDYLLRGDLHDSAGRPTAAEHDWREAFALDEAEARRCVARYWSEARQARVLARLGR